MTKKPKTKLGKPEEIETVPDAWDRFGNAVDVLAKTLPKHRTAKPAKRRKPKTSKPK